MKTLFTYAVPLTLAALLAVPAANAHPADRGYRDDRDRYHDFRDDRYDDRNGYYSRDTRRHLAKYEKERRKRLEKAARHASKHRSEHDRDYYRRVRDTRYDHRHVVNCDHWSHYNRVDTRYTRHRHDHDDINWSVILDVAYGF